MKQLTNLLSRFRDDKKGIAAVEFAIISPILIVMIVGVMETGRLLYTRASLQSGLEVAGRYAMVHPNATKAELMEVAYGKMKVKGAGGQAPSFSMERETGADVDFLVMSATMSHKMLIPMIDLEPQTLTAETIVPVESGS